MTKAAGKKIRVPKLLHHKASGQAFVLLHGRHKYLGKWGAPETEIAYHTLMAEYTANGGHIAPPPAEITCLELVNLYWQHVTEYYRKPDGTPTSQQHIINNSLKPLKNVYGQKPAVEFGPNLLRGIRQSWIAAGLARKTVNDYTAEVRRMFKWAVSYEMIPESVFAALKTLDGLRAGRSEVKETAPVLPVADEDVERVKKQAQRPVVALIDLQLLTGARPGELVNIRPCDIDTSGPVWIANIQKHKTAHHGRERFLFFGPKAQQVLRPFMLRPKTSFLFSPKEAEAERYAKCGTHRSKGQKPKPRMTSRTLGDCYTVSSYRRAIEYACKNAAKETAEKAGRKGDKDYIEELTNKYLWNPYRLRHNAATQVRHRYGLEAAQVLLGHAHADVTQVYAERDIEKARSIAAEIG